MIVAPPDISPERPEWRRSAPFFLFAIALHAAALFYPMATLTSMSETPALSAVIVQLEQARPVTPPEPAKIQPAPTKSPTPPRQQRRTPTPRPVIAIAPKPTAPTPAAFTAPPAIVDPVVSVAAPVISHAAPPITVSAAHFDAAYLHNPRPNYPAISRRLSEEGKVLLRVRVSPDGRAAAVDIEKSSNFERLDTAARQAVAQWRFVPAKRGDEAIEATIIVPLVFRLEN